MLRTSSYCIYVDLPENSKDMLLVHGYTGANDIVSNEVATYLRSLETRRPPNPLYGEWSPQQCINGNEQVAIPEDQTIEILKKRGYLTGMDVQEEEDFFIKSATELHNASRKPGYLFMPTYDCNLRCPYCFQDHMRTNPSFNHLLRTMSCDLVDRIFMAIPKIDEYYGLQDNQQTPRNIGFFGGEPLLVKSRPIVEYIIDKALAIGDTTFWAITNGTDLHAYKNLLCPEKINFLQITLDGPPQEHDKRRIYTDGHGSFEQIARNITMALDFGIKVSVRMNIDRNNIEQLPTLADEIIKRGWNSYSTFNSYTAPIHAANEQTDTKTTLDSWGLDKMLTEMRQKYPKMFVIERPDDSTKNSAKQIFSSQGVSQLQSTFCSAHNGMHIFDAFGDIYACWERTGDSNIRIGHVTQEGGVVLNNPVDDMWQSRNVTTNPTCRKCRYALYCGGGCAVLAEEAHGKFFTNYCDGFASRFRSSVAEAYVDHVTDAENSRSINA